MAVSALRRLAASAPPSVFAAIGEGGRAQVEAVFAAGRVVPAKSPRHASILLVAGAIRDADAAALARVHDQLPHPRASVVCGDAPSHALPEPVRADTEAIEDAITATHRALVRGERASARDILADEPPAPWKGEGDHGQGGEGMMGGVPYGRPMAMTDDDVRDGLALDAYRATYGPFLPTMPPGLALDLTLQGDVIVAARVIAAPYAEPPAATPEAARRRIARLARLMGLAPQADRLLRGERPHASFVARTGMMKAIPEGLGATAPGDDVRARLRTWIAALEGGEKAIPPPAEGPKLVDLLIGLEWFEAMLVINSFHDATLREMTPADPPDGDHDAAHQHGGHGHAHHGHHQHEGHA
ncbi:hypothetical protein RDV64_08535 [Acuticoccus sp. MNP-M23]|uniref:hypothetical protein n=1 Tax=Acuticoccus sp. MNP-M23 TaxID=3072793 RepID=UPI00281557EF|nr:hypothetical protein [Acuticoccus sp. MNP-M23]WMS44421.1 hypothetical protein RDV64_08535 [Acuticoccus sp. MNP-M23]